MKENKYDEQKFFMKYSEMERSKKGLQGAGEWTELQKILPDFKDKKVLDLGCGYGGIVSMRQIREQVLFWEQTSLIKCWKQRSGKTVMTGLHINAAQWKIWNFRQKHLTL